jgi:hypothetical protein
LRKRLKFAKAVTEVFTPVWSQVPATSVIMLFSVLRCRRYGDFRLGLFLKPLLCEGRNGAPCSASHTLTSSSRRTQFLLASCIESAWSLGFSLAALEFDCRCDTVVGLCFVNANKMTALSEEDQV